jgi:hypothetical protein
VEVLAPMLTSRSSFATLSPAPYSLGAAQWPLILSDILSSFFQHLNLVSFYVFSLQMLRHFEVKSKLLPLFPLLHCVTVTSLLVLHFSIAELVLTNRLSGETRVRPLRKLSNDCRNGAE